MAGSVEAAVDDHRDELADTFREMSDVELQERWHSGRLTDVATEVARAELLRRDLEAPHVPPRAEFDEDDPDAGPATFVTVARSLDPLEIEILRARLVAEGIPAISRDTAMIQTINLYAIALGGVRLSVPRASADDARDIIDLVRSGQLGARDEDSAES